MAFQTPILFAASQTPDVLEEIDLLPLKPDEQGRLADYIRSCEVDRAASAARLHALQDCQPEVSTVDTSSWILMVLFGTVVGYTAGRMIQ
jgi:hypothetical protein